MTICEKCRAVLVDGKCPRCEYYAQLDDELRKENENFPKRWKIQIIKKVTGKRVYQVRLSQGTYDHSDNKVTYSWSSRPTSDPCKHDYVNDAWSCNCGNPNCEHIIAVQNWRGIGKTKSDMDISAIGLCLDCGETCAQETRFQNNILRHHAKGRDDIIMWGCPYCGSKRFFLLPFAKYSIAFEYIEALAKIEKDPERFDRAKTAMMRYKLDIMNW